MTPHSTQYGSYEIVRPLASGGMGDIYLGRDVESGDDAVIKLVQTSASLTERLGQLQTFLNEARVMTCLNHPNIVRIYEVEMDRGACFIAMEHLVGWTLAQVMNRLVTDTDHLPIPVIAKVLADVLTGLEYAHDARTPENEPLNLVHRDINHGNLFVTQEGRTKLLDFGIAKTTLPAQQTRAGKIKGTPGYMSPEQCESKPLDRRADVFCVGIVLHEMLSGQRLYVARGVYDISWMDRIVSESIDVPTRHGKSLPRKLVSLCMRALQKDPAHRFQSCGEFLEGLYEALAPPEWATLEDVRDYMANLFASRAGQEAVQAATPWSTTTVISEWSHPGIAALDEEEATEPIGDELADLYDDEGLMVGETLVETFDTQPNGELEAMDTTHDEPALDTSEVVEAITVPDADPVTTHETTAPGAVGDFIPDSITDPEPAALPANVETRERESVSDYGEADYDHVGGGFDPGPPTPAGGKLIEFSAGDVPALVDDYEHSSRRQRDQIPRGPAVGVAIGLFVFVLLCVGAYYAFREPPPKIEVPPAPVVRPPTQAPPSVPVAVPPVEDDTPEAVPATRKNRQKRRRGPRKRR